jgi:DNA-binding MurR/RpiR family transcriptional regulator
VYGAGGSALIAHEICHRLSRLDFPVWAHSELHGVLMAASLAQPGDVFFAISRSGRTVEVIEAMSLARERGATTIALTGFPNSPVGELADIVLLTPAEDTAFRHASLAVRYAQLLIADSVYAAVAQLTLDQATQSLASTSRSLAAHRTSRRGQRSSTTPAQTPHGADS